jgi:glutamate-1-semialdehyde 2,1-aminomutase
MAQWAFHGQHEAFNDAAFRAGQPPWPDTFVAPFGDCEAFEAILEGHRSDIAAVFLEPVMAAAGLVSAPASFFQRVQRAAAKAGALFVLDEATVMRVNFGGVQELLGVDPDLTILGKVIGGGFPVGGVGGKRDLMNVLDPRQGQLGISGTFSGNPVTMAAGQVSLVELTAERIFSMEGKIEAIDEALAKAAAVQGLPYSSRRVGSLLNTYFSEEPPPSNTLRDDGELITRFHLAALNHGVFMAPRALMNASTVLTDQDVAEAITRLEAAVADVAAEA